MTPARHWQSVESATVEERFRAYFRFHEQRPSTAPWAWSRD